MCVDSAYESGDVSSGDSDGPPSPDKPSPYNSLNKELSGVSSSDVSVNDDNASESSQSLDNTRSSSSLHESSETQDETGRFCLNICTWNVGGLWDKLADSEFMSFIKTFDIMCLCETFLEKVNDSLFPEFLVFVKPAIKLGHMGRRSGGLVTLVKKKIADQVEIIDMVADNLQLFRISGNLLNEPKDIFLIFSYVCPQYSPYYRDKEFKCGLHQIEECILSVNEKYECPNIILCGDLNSRTGEENVHYDRNLDDDSVDVVRERGTRHSMDTTTNSFGRELLNICYIYGLKILNGD